MSKIGKIYMKDPVSSIPNGPCLTPITSNKTKGGITSIIEPPKKQEQPIKPPEVIPPSPPPIIQIEEPTVNP